jgi:flagellar hook protein FlgE
MSSGIMQALYNSVSGLFGFSQSLDTISNNISNMNTPGFRGSDSFFENIMDGDGTRIAGTGQDTSQGQSEQTTTDTDVAIEGDGLFVLKDPQGNLYYTRAGQFEFNASGLLVDSVNKYLVQGYDPAGNYGDININSYQTLPAAATTTVNLTGNLSSSAPSDSVSDITVYDAQGNANNLTLTLTNDNPTSGTGGPSIANNWTVTITDSTGNTVGSGLISFGTDGTPEAGGNTVTMSNGIGGGSQSITFNFGTPGSLSGATSIAATSTNLAAQVADGHAGVGISSKNFDSNGVLQFTYADGDTKAGPQLALASFADESSLQLIQGNLYLPPQDQAAKLGRPGTSVFGQIQGSSLEMSNVDLTQELADMIVIQRGYQASSRVMTISSDMLQQLYQTGEGG